MDPKVALRRILAAWDVLPGGKPHSVEKVEAWLRDPIWHAINDCREALGEKRTDRDAAGNVLTRPLE